MRELVHLNIYDMTSLNQYISPIGVGVYHSAVQIYEKEYGFGGHSFPVSGVFEIQPKDEIALGEESFKFKETIVIGQTDFNKDEVREIINNLGNEFRGDQYHLLHKNCNHFSDKLTRILCGKGIPNWVNRLASVIVSVPLLERIIGKEYLTPIQLDNNLCSVIETESRNQIEDDKPGQIKLFNRKKL